MHRWLIAFGFLLIAPVARADVDPHGQFAQDIELEAPAFHGLAPHLGLHYRSGGGNGVVGLGWAFDGGSTITRVSKTHGAPKMDATDIFQLDGEDLVPCASGSTSPSCTSAIAALGSSANFYSTRVESFTRVGFLLNAWYVWSPDGTKRVLESKDGGRTYQLTTVIDTHNNIVSYAYTCGTGPCELDSITYGPHAIKLYRETRQDPVRRDGHTLQERLRTVAVSTNGKLLRAYQLTYSANARASQLRTFQQFGNDAAIDASGRVTGGTSLPAMTFTSPSMLAPDAPVVASAVTPDLSQLPATNVPAFGHRFANEVYGYTLGEVYDAYNDKETLFPYGTVVGDFDGDGRADWLSWFSMPTTGITTPHCDQLKLNAILESRTGHQPMVSSVIDATTNELSCSARVWVADLDGDRRDDLVVFANNHLVGLYSNGDGTFRLVHGGPAWTNELDRCVVGDFDGDGHDDFACAGAAGLAVARPVVAGGTWATSSDPLANMTVGATLFASADVNGDGLADILAAEAVTGGWRLWTGLSSGDGTFRWEWLPTPWPAAVTPTFQAADINGDGKADAVFAAAGQVFTAVSYKGNSNRYQMSPTPFSATWAGHVLLGDNDGDGKADLYLADSVRWAHGRGDGTFDAPTATASTAACTPFLVDLNGDHRSDVLCVNDDEANWKLTLSDAISPVVRGDLVRWMTGDVTGDGLPDLVYVRFANPGYEMVVIPAGSTTPVTSYFGPSATQPLLDEPDASRFMLADVGGPAGVPDGRADLVLIASDGNTLDVSTFLSNGSGGFTPAHSYPWRDLSTGTIASYGAKDLQNWRPADLDGNGATDFVHFYTTGNGVFVEELVARGDGTFINGGGQWYLQGSLATGAVASFVSTDVNGDGITDFVYAEPTSDATGAVTGGTIWTLIGNGDTTFTAVAQSGVTGYRNMHFQTADLDGDGQRDLALVTHNVDPVTSCMQIAEYLSDGAGHWTSPAPVSACNTANNPREWNMYEDTAFAHFLDVDGDGRDDLVHVSTYFDGGPQLQLSVGNASAGWQPVKTEGPAMPSKYDFRPWHWSTAIDPASGSIVLQSVTPLASPQIVMSHPSDRISHVDNGVGGLTDVTYAALVGHRTYLPEGALPRVVASVTVADHAAPQWSSETMTYTFDGAKYSNALRRMTGFATRILKDHSAQRVSLTTLDDKCGAVPYESYVTDLAGNTLALDVMSPVSPGAGAPFTCLTYDHARYACANGSCTKRIDTTTTYDVYGNVSATTEAPGGAFTKLVQTPTATPNLGAFIVDRRASESTYSYEGNAWVLKATRSFVYDGAGGPGVVGAKGDVTETRTWDGSRTLLTDYQYTPSGLVKSVATPVTTTTTTYDATYGLYPSTVAAGGLTTTHVVDLNTGLETAVIDPNGARTTVTYDALGRTTRVDRPDHSYSTTTYSMPGSFRIERTAANDGSVDGVWSERWTDGLGRTFHTTRKDGASQDTIYTDATSHPARVSNVYVGASSPVGYVGYDYDALGRVLVRHDTDGSTTSHAYGATAVTSYDQKGVAKVQTQDGRGQVTRVDEINAGVTASTQYLYDVLGHTLRITDAQGNATSFVYDGLGRQTSATDPDRGTLQTVYKANGLVDYTLDAAGNRIAYSYDALGRVIERDDTGPQSPPRTIRMYWDKDASGALAGASLGRLAEVTDTQVSAQLDEKNVFDAMGRPTSTKRCVGTTCMTMGQSYDAGGRLASLTYPDGEAVAYGYDVMGRPASVGGFATATYNELDQVTTLGYANGQTTTNAYDPARHWLNTEMVTLPPVHLGRGTITPQQYLASYTHDTAGRISTLDLTNGALVHLAYTYDDLGRLTAVTSDAAHSETFRYDSLGRMTNSSYLGDLHYNDPLHVHAPTHADAANDDRTYDRLGNARTVVDAHTGRNLTLAWSADGTLASIRDNAAGKQTAFVYDRTGQRVAKLGGVVPELYFGPLVEQRNGVLVKYYTLAGRVVARNDGAMLYYTQDHRGSTRLAATSLHAVVDTYDYSAFGRPIAKSEQVAQDLELGGGSFDDESGLVYMNARYYDSEMAQFASADTIIPNRLDPQSLHRYSYTEQDPINFSDPSGHLRMQIEWKKSLDAQAMAIDSTMNACSGASADMAFGCAVLKGQLDKYPSARENDLDLFMAVSDARANERQALEKELKSFLNSVKNEPHLADTLAVASDEEPDVDEVTIESRAAADTVTNQSVCVEQGEVVKRPETLTELWQRAKSDIKAIPFDMFAFIGTESPEYKTHAPGGAELSGGPSIEGVLIGGLSNEHGAYAAGILAGGVSASYKDPEAGESGVGFFAGKEYVLGTTGDGPMCREPESGGMAELYVESRFFGIYNFGGQSGLFAGVRGSAGFVGFGLSFETLLWEPRVFYTVHRDLFQSAFGGAQ